VPLKSLLLAVHLKLLSFLTGATDVVSGLLANGRPEGADGDRVIGGFLNAMPCRVDLAPGFWTDLARQVFAAERELLPWRRFPLADLAELGPERGPVGRPPYDTLFNFTHFHVYERLERLPGVAVLGSWGTEQTYFPLTVQANVHELTHAVSLALDFQRAELDAAEVEGLAARYVRILEAVATAPGTAHDDLCLLADGERQQVLCEWNDTARPAAEWTIHERFLGWAARTPAAPALVWGERTVTYGELAAQARRVAGRLLDLQLPAEARVGVLLERSPDLVAAILGAMAAGAAYVPLDPAYPQERLDAMLEDSGALALVTRRGMRPGIHLEDLAGGAPEVALPQVDPARLMAVIYTSGSTGKPKGVAVEHRSMAACLAGAASLVPPEERAGMLAAASICFDLSTLELFLPLTHGGTAILAENALDLPRLPARGAVRFAGCVPSTAAELLRGGGFPPGIRTLYLGGEALPSGLVRALHEELPGCRIVNAYGPTEATIYSTLDHVDPLAEAAPTLGLPTPEDRAFVLGADLQPVLPGVAGEIWLGGRGVTRGYLGRPDLTADRFRPDPWGALHGEPGARLYRTGDLGRRRSDGRIEFLGRRDHQVKLRGFRIELGDVEAALARHPAIAGAVVVERRDPDDPGEARLVAYVVPRQGLPATGWGVELRGFLRGVLPAHMVPSDVVVLDALPLTPSGKVDRRALPEPDAGRAAEARPWRAPQTPIEEELCATWARLFDLERVSADDDFFELGGHSLLATQLVSDLRAAFRLELPLRALFDFPVLADLAREVERALREGKGTAVPPLVPQFRPAGGIPLSFAQQRLWFLDRLEPESPFYNVPVAVRLAGRLDPAALAGAFAAIVRRHEALRTRFPEREGRPVQVVEGGKDGKDCKDDKDVMAVVDLSGLAFRVRAREAERRARELARRPFDLGKGPLLRFALFHLAAGEHFLLAVFHHIVSDGWSMGVFLRETAELYRAAVEARSATLPPLALQYADFALWQRGWLTGEALAGQLDYWRPRLAGVPPLALPTDRPRPAVPAYRGARRPLDLPGEVGALARREGATLFMTLFAAFAAVLGRWAGQESLAVGTPVANRTRAELEPLIGFFVNTLVLPADLSGDPDGRALIARCREAALGAYAHQDLPFEKLVEELRPERELARAPLFQVLLVLQNTPLPTVELPGLLLEPVDVETGAARLDLTLVAAEQPGGLAGWLEHDLHLFDPATAARLTGHLALTLQTLAADPGRRLSDLPLLTAAESHQVLREWGGDRLELEPAAGPGSGIEDRIVARARAAPGALAVVQGERELTYGELDARSAALARILRARGVGPEVVVALPLRKSPEAIVAILAVLRAGGAYLPLDPDYPEERLAWLRADARALELDLETLTPGLTGLRPAYRTPGPPGEGGETTLDVNPAYLRSCCFSSSGGVENGKNVGAAFTPLSRGSGSAAGRGAGGEVLAGHPAYLLYTSGSTGRPKGVVITRGGLLTSTLARDEAYAAAVTAFLILPSLAFDSSVAGVFWTLCQGGTLVLPADGEGTDPASLARLVRERRISHWLSIPSLWGLILDRLETPSSLAAVIVAGEPCPADLPRRHAAILPGVPLVNEYGPTEGTVWATVGELPAGERITIGRPIANTRVLVLDRAQRPVPAGVPGEVFLGGEGLARGYFNRPDLTAERFVPDPLAAGPGARLYRTGDLARWLPDGRLDLLGRIDEQVKIRGFRIEPGEIEAALERAPGVRQAAVVTRELSSGDRRLAGCVVPDGPLDLEALRAHLAGQLPAHLVPAELLALDALPLSPNGKVDRSALRALVAGRAPGDRGAAPPSDEVERRLAAIWEELLEVQGVGREDGFFELGGHSLLAVRLVARIEQEFGCRLPLAALFRGATLASLAVAVRAADGSVPPPLVLLRDGGEGRPFFWFHPLGGSSLCYVELARRLSGRALYGLEAEGNGFNSLADLADRYAAVLVRRQPAGPYLLGGWSFGGLLAWETARRLEELGREVALVALLDTRPPAPDAPFPEVDDTTLDELLRSESGETGPELRAVVRAHLDALRAYRPEPLACPVLLFLAADRPHGETIDRAALWLPLARGGLAVETLPGDHFSLLAPPAVDELAVKLRARLA
jgi:amino acid adenylation domain-containing protein